MRKFLITAYFLFISANAFTQDAFPDTSKIESDSAVTIAPVTSLIVSNYKYDNAEKLQLVWVPSIDASVVELKIIDSMVIFRITNNGEPVRFASVMDTSTSYIDEGLDIDSLYSYYITVYSKNYSVNSTSSEPISPEREWLNFGRTYLFIVALVLTIAIVYYIESAKKGKKLFVRKIAGLEAVDDAIGRATEMGRPILFIPGINDMDDVQTLAAITILGKVAQQVAEYDTQIRMPVSRSLVMTAARETIKTAYQTAGRPDAYNDDMVNYVTDEQFGYVAAVDGVMVREKPATIFLLGAFFAESLILAETGNSIGAIQIAGTARPAQLPFFIAACDFTLIGEELFAASAYLSGEPKMLGSLKGQDIGKGIAMAAIFIGVLALTLGQMFDVPFLNNLANGIKTFFEVN